MADDSRSAVEKVLDTTELLEMVLPRLPIKSLTRALPISKIWNSAILASPRLRRHLFLDPAPAQAHLEWKKEIDPKYHNRPSDGQPLEKSAYRAVIASPTSQTKVIVEAHQVLQACTDLKTYLETHWVDYSMYKKVSPSTLLLQPPLEEVMLQVRYASSRGIIGTYQEGGVTFGEVCRKLDKLRLLDRKSTLGSGVASRRRSSLTDLESYVREEDEEEEATYRPRKEQINPTCIRIMAKGVVAEGSPGAVEAQQAWLNKEMARAKGFST